MTQNSKKRGFILLGLLCLIFLIAKSSYVFAFSQDEQDNIRVYKERSAAVVNVTSTTIGYDFFYNPVPQTGAGSGVLIDTFGTIVTNYHVIEDARAIEVTLSNGAKLRAEVLGVDPDSDLAVLKIDPDGLDLISVPFGSSGDLQVGQKVLAIGNPFGLERTLTTGIVSSVGRTMKTENGTIMHGIIQTDAAINPGNSGGPLLNYRGEMIGLNTAIFSPGGGSIGIGFAVPVDTIKRIVPQLVNKGRVARVWLGITGQNIDRRVAFQLSLSSPGVLIAEVLKGSPASRAKLRGATRRVRLGNRLYAVGGDLIISIDGEKLSTMEELNIRMRDFKAGLTVLISIVRGARLMDKKVLLEEMPSLYK